MTQQTLNRLMARIKSATEAMNLAEITRLSKLAQRVQAIEGQMSDLRDELSRIDRSIAESVDVGSAILDSGLPRVIRDPILPDHQRQDRDVAVEIDWSRCGVNRPRTRISRRMMSDTMVSVMEEILAALGSDALHKLSALRVSRGPLVSRNPRLDYVNTKTGANYVSHPIGHSGFHVLTHSGTAEKIAALKDAWRTLGLNPGALIITKGGAA